MKLEELYILSYNMSCGTTLLVSSELVVDLDYVGQFVGQIILSSKSQTFHSQFLNGINLNTHRKWFGFIPGFGQIPA